MAASQFHGVFPHLVSPLDAAGEVNTEVLTRLCNDLYGKDVVTAHPLIDRLSRIPNIRYIKDASNNTGRLLSIINQVAGRMQVFAASAHIPACVMLIGGVGAPLPPQAPLTLEGVAEVRRALAAIGALQIAA